MALRDGATAIGNIHEAEAAAIAINRILTEYNISLCDIEEPLKKDEILEENVLNKSSRYEAFTRQLTACICKYNFCTSLWSATSRKVSIVGEEINVKVCLYLQSLLYNNFTYHAHKAANNIELMSKRQAFIESFLLGCVTGIDDKFEAEQTSKSLELVKYNKHAIDLYLNSRNVRKAKSKTPNIKDYCGFSNGFTHGRNISINKGIDNSTDNSQKTLSRL